MIWTRDTPGGNICEVYADDERMDGEYSIREADDENNTLTLLVSNGEPARRQRVDGKSSWNFDRVRPGSNDIVTTVVQYQDVRVVVPSEAEQEKERQESARLAAAIGRRDARIAEDSGGATA